ncbi:MAG: ChbG/HpnK family deacetylase [Acidobacteriota bacterium]
MPSRTKNQLIVTADDLGLHPGMTLGAIRAHREGIVTACSVSANGRALAHALESIQDCPNLDAGVHLTLVEEVPLSAAADVPSLVTAGGTFHRNFAVFAGRYFAGAIRITEVERELRAQIELLLARGLSLVHANGHQHLHILGKVFELVLSLAEEYGIRYVRIPYEAAPKRSVRGAGLAAMNRFANSSRARAAGRVLTNDRTIGIAQAGHLDAASVVSLIPKVHGLTELVCHPGVGGVAIAAEYKWGYAWDTETDALCDPAVKAALTDAHIELVGVSAASAS